MTERRIAWAIWLAANAGIAFVPLLGGFNYYSAATLTLVAVATGGLMGLHAESKPHLATPVTLLVAKLGRDLMATMGAALAIAGLNALRVPPCEPLIGLAMVALLPAPSFALAWALGASLRGLSPKSAGPLFGLFGLASIGASLARAYFTPPIYVFNHLLGYWPGSLYDELIEIDARLVAFRSLSLLGAFGLLSLLRASFRAPRIGRRGQLGLICAGLIVFMGADHVLGSVFRFRTTDSALAASLPVKRGYQGLRIHLPASTSPEAADQVLEEHAFYYDALRSDLGIETSPQIDSYVFANPRDKASFLGASHTSFVKPWRGQLVIDGPSAEHPVLPHEMVHALLGDAHPSMLGIPMRGFLPDLVLVEGVAVAVSPFRGQSPHSLARALLEQNRLPELHRILDPSSFWFSSSRQAYQLAGSFVDWLLENHGTDALLSAYSGTPLDQAFDQSLDELDLAWRSWLSEQPLPQNEADSVEALLRERSLLKKPCPSVVARLQEQLAALPRHQRRAHYNRLCALFGERDDIRLRRALNSFSDEELVHESGRLRALNLTATEHSSLLVRLIPFSEHTAREELIDELQKLARTDAEARRAFAFRYASTSDFGEALDASLADRERDPEYYRRRLFQYLAGQLDEGAGIAMLASLPSDPLARYLLARRLVGGGLHLHALSLLEDDSLRAPSIGRERHRMRCRGLYQAPPAQRHLLDFDALLDRCAAWSEGPSSPLDADRAAWAARRASRVASKYR